MNFSEIVRLSVQQRIVLVDAIWESITADRRKNPMSEEEIEEAQQRIMAAQKKPSYLSQWEKMKKLQTKKNNQMKYLFYILFFASQSLVSFGQNEFKKAEEKFDEGKYNEAINLYKIAFARGNSERKCECMWKIAESYRKNADIKQAKIWYENVTKGECTQANLAQIYLADTTKINFAKDDTSNSDVVYKTKDKSYSLIEEKYLLSSEKRSKYNQVLKCIVGSAVNPKFVKYIDTTFVIFNSNSVKFLFHNANGWNEVQYSVTGINNTKKHPELFRPASIDYTLLKNDICINGVSIVEEKECLAFWSSTGGSTNIAYKKIK